MSDPNEGNPFEPPETPKQRHRRVDEMIRENVDKRREPAMMLPPTGIAYRLAKHIIYLRATDPDWESHVLKACEDALGCQDKMIAEYQKLLFEVESTRFLPMMIVPKPKDG